MEAPAHRFHRVLLALEDYAGQEELLLQAKDYAAVSSLQSRAASLVDDLVAAANTVDPGLRQRVHVVIARRERSAELISRHMERVRDELQEIQLVRQRIAQVAPVYRQSTEAIAPGQLCGRG